MNKLKFIIFTILSVFSFSTITSAKIYNTYGYGSNSTAYMYPSGSVTMELGNQYSNASIITYMDLKVHANQDSSVYPDTTEGLNNGKYLFDFYITSPSNLIGGTASCYKFSTDFGFYDSNSGILITDASRIKSNCVNSYYTQYNGVNAHHYLVSFTLSNVAETDPQLFRFRIANYNNGLVGPNGQFSVIPGSIQDYDTDIVNMFKTNANINTQTNQNQTIIDQNTQTNSKLDTQIQQNNEAENTRKGILGTLQSVFSSIADLPSKIWEFIKSGFENVVNAVSSVVDVIGDVFNTLIELPGKLIDLLIDALKALFIPEDTSFIDNFVDSIENKLGFIASVPISIIDFGISLANASWENVTSVSLPNISIFGYNFWNAQEVDISAGLAIFQTFRYITDCLCVAICARGLFKIWEGFTSDKE